MNRVSGFRFRVSALPRDGRREGVALILVLGMLSLLLLMAVAFSVSMRVERSGAGNSVFNVYSRNLIWTGLAEALNHVNSDLGGGGTPELYPDWEVLGSVGGDPVRVVWGEAMKYLPGVLTNTAMSTDSHWSDTVERGGIRGRYAYLVLNSGGLLDGNRVAGRPRTDGADPGQIVISNLTEILSAGDFVAYRDDPDVRYETLRELNELQRGHGLYAAESSGHFMTYSRFPAGRLEPDGTVVTNVPCIGHEVSVLETLPTADPAEYARIAGALTAAGILLAERDFVYTNLLDYLDADNVPRKLDSPCTESVPMFNEVMIEVRGTAAEGSVLPFIEWFYPFVKPSADTFRIDAVVTARWDRLTAPTSTVVDAAVWTDVAAGYGGGTELHHSLRTRGLRTALGWAAGDSVRVTVKLWAAMKNSAGDVVDAVPYPATNAPLTFVTNLLLGAAAAQIDKECRDPRFNWDAEAMWFEADTDSLSTTNAETIDYLSRMAAGDPAVDNGMDMYVSDGERLVSVGELGNLLRGVRDDRGRYAWWKTIRLYDHVGSTGRRAVRDDVLYELTVETNLVRRGLVNVNTTHTNALKCVFEHAPLGYPASPRRLTETEAFDVADTVIATSTTHGAYADVSEICGLDWRGLLPGKTDLQIESGIAYSYRLLGTRQHLFTIVVAAGPWSRGVAEVRRRYLVGDWLSTQRAVFEVWRDPFPDADGHHPCFVRLVKWLTDG